MKKLFTMPLSIILNIILLAILTASPASADSKTRSYDLNLQASDRFTVVCRGDGVLMEYGDNKDPNGVVTGVSGRCYTGSKSRQWGGQIQASHNPRY